MAILHIKDYLDELIASGVKTNDIAKDIGISVPMASQYRNHKWNASLDVAKRVYTINGVVLHPFSKESLIYEIGESNV